MDIALIPPVQHLKDFCTTSSYHLVLSHLLETPEYQKFYEDPKREGYIILDNSAHEQKVGEAIDTLLLQAGAIRADEIVLPDRLFDRIDTVEMLRQSLNFIYRNLEPTMSWKYMIVPQGAFIYDLEECLKEMLELYYKAWSSFPEYFPNHPTIGISKDYEVYPGHLMEVVSRFRKIAESSSFRGEVHMLGWGRRLWDLGEVARDHLDWLRSVDSAKPFVYALANIQIYSGELPDYPKRPHDYFYRSMTVREKLLSSRNVEIFGKAARGEV